jgi:hypothetical protein
MIPYDDLVAALATWRARQGLSVAQPAGAAPAPTAKGSAAPAGKTPPARAPSSPQPVVRVATPAAPPRPATAPRAAVPAPPALSGRNDFDDSEGAAVDGGNYDNTGDDFVMSVADDSVETGEATAIGGAPEAPADGLLVPKRGKRNPDW